MEPIILGNYESTTRYSYKPDIAYKKTIGGRRPDAGGMENADYWIDSAGDGGIAGKGGNITVASSAKIYAFNGNMITDENYDK